MSHYMTALAMKQRGLKPAAKIVLYWLADHHNGETGLCCPSLTTLEDECEMGRSAIIRNLDLLESLKLIGKETRLRENGSKTSNSYLLYFELVSKRHHPSVETIPPLVSNQDVPNLGIKNLGNEPVRESAHVQGDLLDVDISQEEEPKPKQIKARLPENWTPSDDDIAAAKKLHLNDSEIMEIADDFQTYWTERTDKVGRKTQRGWASTWRNNCSRIAWRYIKNRSLAGAAQSNGHGQAGGLAGAGMRRRAARQK